MDIRIQQLPPAIANQIAAGEVIERPASVVKELLENSLDAHADSISIDIGYGGLNQIRISDNGVGIVAEDLPLAIAAHATSKITKLDDLYAIDSMGFRGEALASIASIAKVTISSRTSDQEHAMMLQSKGADYTLSPCARALGTTIDVSDLFFNAPVRKRFLKSEQLEFQAIETVVKRFALSAPHIAIQLKHNNKPLLSLPAAVNEAAKHKRMTKILGSAFVKEAIFLDVERSDMRLYGWVSSPNFQRSQNDRQWIYINHRMVKDKLVNHALKQSYEDLLHPGRFPACLLYLTIKTSEVDVNVHPTKHEVRFQQPRLVHDFFTSTITEALSLYGEAKPVGDYPLDSTAQGEFKPTDVCEPYKPMQGLMPFEESQSGRAVTSLLALDSESQWIMLNNRYALIVADKQPHMVDVHAFYKSWLYEQLSSTPLPLASRPLLVPVTYSISEGLLSFLDGHQELLGQFGFQLDRQSEDKILIQSMPIATPYLNIRGFLDSLTHLENLQASTLLEQLCQAQDVAINLFSMEERAELLHWLRSAQSFVFYQQKWCKPLTLDACQGFIDA